MKSKNNLSITGVVSSSAIESRDASYVYFYLGHYYGGGRPPLFLKCVMLAQSAENVPGKGERVEVDAYLRPHGDRFIAVVKKVKTIKDVR